LILIVGVTLLTGILAGSYPAFYLSSSSPILIFRQRLMSGRKGSRLRKLLVVVQFTFSIILILMTVISIKQSRHNLAVDLGFDRSDVIAVTMPQEIRGKLETIEHEWRRGRDILSVSASAALPIEWKAEKQVLPEGYIEGEAFAMDAYAVDYGFVEMLDIGILRGRSFSREYDDAAGFIINETAAQHLQWENPIGKRLAIGERKGMVIGVAEDYHFKSILLEKIAPAVLYLAPDEVNYIFVKYSAPENFSGVIESIEEKWRLVAPDLPFEYTTLENAFSDVFQGDKTSEMTGILGVLAIFLSCLGLFGLSTYSVERRKKEIGIRKVLGASASRIVRMLARDFIKLVAIANLIAIPIAYFMMNAIIRFIYAYPISIGVEIFIITTILTLLIAFLTVFSQTIRSALVNPANSLKHE
jgi:putative ABC transport system permease protein